MQLNLSVVRGLAGADPSAGDDDKWTPLHIAAYHGHLDVVKSLVAEGVDVNRRVDEGQTALHMAAKNGHTEVVR